jgi:hypothetical protein
MTDQEINDLAYKMWLSDTDADPMLHTSWQASKLCYRRLAEVALEWVESHPDEAGDRS